MFMYWFTIMALMSISSYVVFVMQAELEAHDLKERQTKAKVLCEADIDKAFKVGQTYAKVLR